MRKRPNLDQAIHIDTCQKGLHVYPRRIFALVVLVTLPLLAQEFRATLQGTVTDPSQAVVPAAHITLKNVETGIENETVSAADGHYLFPFVAPGSYSLTVRSAGFKTMIRDGIQLSINDNLKLDVVMPVGQANDTVQVTSEVAAVQAESSSLGTIINQKLIEDQPEKGHSVMFLYQAANGVVGNQFNQQARPSDVGNNLLFTANGAPVATGEISMDGVSNTVNDGRGIYLSPWIPASEAVAEVKLLMGTLPAEYGRAAGIFTNIVIKSGTNTLHGSLHEYFQNSDLNADLFFQRGQGQKLIQYGDNVYGGTVGGPVYLPHLYNGRNRTFFFFSYEGAHEASGQGPTLTMPTPLMRTGNFSQFSGAIYDPFSESTVNGVPTRVPFPGNITPNNRMDPVAQKIMAYWPLPNINNSGATPWVGDYVQGSKPPLSRGGWILKFDHKLADKHQTFVRLNHGASTQIGSFDFPGFATPGRNLTHRPYQGVAIDDTYLISPSTVLDTRIGYTYGKEQQQPWSAGFSLASLGFPQQFINTLQFQNFPTINVSGFEQLEGSIGWIEQPGYNYSLHSTLSKQHGRHLLKTGVQMNLFRGNFLNNTYPAGNYSFNPSQTGGPRADTPAAGSGFAMASFLLGVVNGGSVETDSAVSVQNLYGGVFVQDDFRVTSRLTLNLGLRWEYQTPVTERYNRTTRGFAYNTPSPLQVPGFNLTGGLLYAGVNGQPRGLYNPDYNNWGPRIGLADSLNSRTVIRAGYSLSYIPVVGAVSATGYSNTTSMVTTQNGGITPYNVLSNPFPTGQLPFIGNSQGLATLIGQNITFVNPSDRTPKFHNWHVDLQREIAARTVVTASYVGSRAYDLFAQTNDFVSAINQNVNQFNPQYLSLGTALLATVPNPFYGIITSGSLAGTTIAESQLLKPYPQYSGVSRLAPGYGNSHYESAQFQLEKRTSNGVTALVSYTIAKNITDLNNPTNVYNRQAARSLASFDSPQRLAISVTWDVPFGQGRHFGTHAPRALDFVAGGWALSSFQLFQAGFPLAFSLAKSAAGSGSGVPNAIGDPSQGVSGVIEARLHHYFNTAAFAQPPDFTFGNVSPYIGTVRAPGMNNIDASLSKVFRATEKVNVLFRATSFNFLNHPVFSAPNTSLGNAAFGSITSQANVSRQMEFTAKILF